MMDMKELKRIEAKQERDIKEWNFYNSDEGMEQGYNISPEREEEIIERMFLVNTIKQLHAENERYKKALEFYADEENYEITGEKTYIGHGDFTEETWIEVDEDRGQKARQALDEAEYDESARAYELDREFK